jgi:hypothetical protein
MKSTYSRTMIFTLFFLVFPFLHQYDPTFAQSEAEGSTDRQEALSSLVQSLEDLRADDAKIEAAKEWLAEEETRLQEELDTLQSDIQGLQAQLVNAEKILKGAEPLPGITLEAANGEKISLIDRTVDFASEIFPILEKNCFSCHGSEKQKSRLRLDSKSVVFEGGLSGPAVAPGDGEGSLLFRRIAGLDGEEQMPPTEEKLTGEEIGLIRAWIDRGAEWPDGIGVAEADSIVKKHWAYVAPTRPELPTVKDEGWVGNPIDRFILARMEEEGLAPSEPASKERLIRRASLDLIGLPPTMEEVDAFLADESPDAYENLVDRLLASPKYGERWTRIWLDLARYADTNGYEKDLSRSMWPWRDWVIEALNENMPFDQFTIEQLAGDLLPDPSRDQLIATGFHRNTMLNDEGGIDPEEFRIVAVKDRVDTTAAVWLGTTLGCAQCHNHKYDPFTQKEYYQFLAFFNNTKDVGVGQAPELQLPSPEEQEKIEAVQSEIAELETAIDTQTPELYEAQKEWEAAIRGTTPEWTTLIPRSYASTEGGLLVQLEDRTLLAVGENPEKDKYVVSYTIPTDGIKALQLEPLVHETLPHTGPGRGDNAGFVLSKMEVSLTSPEDGSTPQPVRFTAAFADYEQEGYPIRSLAGLESGIGWSIASFMEGKRRNRSAVFEISDETPIPADSILHVTMTHDHGNQHNLGRFRISATTSQYYLRQAHLPKDIRAIVRMLENERGAVQTEQLASFYRSISPLLSEPRTKLAQSQTALAEAQKNVPKTMVMEDLPEGRQAHILVRGEFLNPGDPVDPAVPRIFPKLPNDTPKDRLALARWLVSRDNPLTARVIVNRIWSAYFGKGIVKTSEDFGTQGDLPTHPELLDWLAVEFMEGGWDLKALHKLIVTSSIYKQSSNVSQELLERDPNNKLYARAPRFRMDAERIRDNSLAVSGLLTHKIGGPSVFPPQPPGIWDNSFAVFDTIAEWIPNTDENRYRRGIYTFARRTAPYATYLLFDAPYRDVCTIERSRTNTPLQALATLNDPAFVEASGALAKKIMEGGGTDLTERAVFGWRTCVSRKPDTEEIQTQVDLYQKAFEKYSNDEEAAKALIEHSRVEAGEHDPAALAAWTVVANVLLNLDEMVTKG